MSSINPPTSFDSNDVYYNTCSLIVLLSSFPLIILSSIQFQNSSPLLDAEHTLKTISLSTHTSFHVYLQPKRINVPFVIAILLKDTLPVLLPVIWKPGILLDLQVRVPILSRMFLQHIHSYILKNHKQYNTEVYKPSLDMKYLSSSGSPLIVNSSP